MQTARRQDRQTYITDTPREIERLTESRTMYRQTDI